MPMSSSTFSRLSNLEVQVRNSLYLLRLILTVHVHHVRWGVKGILLSLLKVELLMGFVELQSAPQGSQSWPRALHRSLECINLSLSLVKLGIEINNKLISGVDHLMVGLCQLS